MSQPEILWRPNPGDVGDTRISHFLHAARICSGVGLNEYNDLYQWSIEQPESFWRLLWEFLGIRASEHGCKTVTPGERMRETLFFQDARLNFAENLLADWDTDRAAVIFRDESNIRIELSGRELRRQVAATAAGLRSAGVCPGDRVAGFVPNHPSTLVAMLAAASIGAVWASCSPEFGVSAVVDRLAQIEPKILIAADGYLYNGKAIDSLARASDIAQAVTSIKTVVVFPNLGTCPNLSGFPKAVLLEDFQEDDAELNFAQLPFSHPLFVLFTSGTTGVPKCIVHCAGGALIQLMKDHQLHCNLGKNDRLLFYSTCGWMMWNWLVTALASRCAIVLYDGAPLLSSNPEILWEVCEDEGVTAFGAGARYYGELQNLNLEPGKKFPLRDLKLIMSTGSILAPESYDYIYAAIKSDALLASVTGGTDILCAFALGVPTLPLYRGEIQCRALGMAVNIFDDDAHPIQSRCGELVCTKPFPSMPLKFWGDVDNRRYDEAYFSHFDNVWCHGDFAELTSRGGLIIHGRSDAVLNPGGVRIGTAEIYRQVEKIPAIVDAVCVGQNWDNDVRVVLFVVLKPTDTLTEELQQKIRQIIRDQATPRHVPNKIVAVTDVPRTLTGKIAELAVRDLIHGRIVKNTGALANPQCLSEFSDRAELAT